MFDMTKMMGKMKEVQERMKQTKEKLVTIKAIGESGGGMVKAVVNGKKQIISIDIDPSMLKEKDKTLVQDLTVAAVNKALEDVETLAQEELRKSTDGLLPNIPGINLGNLMG